MKNIIIKNNQNIIIGENQIEDLKVQEFLDHLKESSPYGKPEHQRELTPRIENPDGTVAEATYETVPSEYTVEILDITAEVESENRINILIASGQVDEEICKKCLRAIGGHNKERQLTTAQITAMAAAFVNVDFCLTKAMPKSAKALITAITPDEVIVTTELKNLLLEILKAC